MKKIVLLFSLLMCLQVSAQLPQTKREFRGAWIQMINGQFMGMSRDAMQAELIRQLDAMQRCRVNTIMFQVRGEADAMYHSPYEPWSRFFTGEQGVSPLPFWDPLEWMVKECHRRGMELHAWINPYRAKTKGTKHLGSRHPYLAHPERFVKYGDLLLFNPGLEENRHYICQIVSDIVDRYDIDGIHIDDYFYPYPQPGLVFDDQSTFFKHRRGFNNLADWRRDNVNRLIQELYVTIHSHKPWVKFGVSPFGIYHNTRNGGDIPGSATNGLQNYDDLYADVLLWVNRGWVDYIVPQIYWEIGHPAADYDTLVRWWGEHASGRLLVVGQDVKRSIKAVDPHNENINQLPRKYMLQRSLPGIEGSCIWYSAAVANNEGNSAIAYQRLLHPYPALQPTMPYIDGKRPKKVRHLTTHGAPDGFYLFWLAPKSKKEMDRAVQYVVYRFRKGEKRNYDDPSKIVAITRNTVYRLPYTDGQIKYSYAVTALDRMQNESKPKRKTVRL